MEQAIISESFLEERRRLGQDRLDEVWEGVLHMVLPPSPKHQRVEGRLYTSLRVIAERRGLEAFTNVGVYDPEIPGHKSYRVPDITITDKRYVSDRGIEGRAELVIEILSPDDESRDKLPFFARIGVREAWLIDRRQLSIEVFAGTQVIAAVAGVSYAPSLGLELRVDGHTLHIKDGADMYEVDIRDSM